MVESEMKFVKFKLISNLIFNERKKRVPSLHFSKN